MGRKQNPLIAQHFERGQKLANNSNRYSHTCIHCAKVFPKGRPEVLTSHLAKCSALSPELRQQFGGPSPNDQTWNGIDHGQDLSMLTQLADVADAAANENVPSTTAPVAFDNNFSISVGQAGPHMSLPYVPATHFPVTSGYPEDPMYQPPPMKLDQMAIDPVLRSTMNGLPATTSTYYHALPSAHSFDSGASNVDALLLVNNPFAPVSDLSAHNGSFVQEQPKFSIRPLAPNGVQDEAAPNAMDIQTSQVIIDHGHFDDIAHQQPPAKKPRKNKSTMDETQKSKAKEMRQVRPCLRCGRLQKSCGTKNGPKNPCEECVKVKVHKNWAPGCRKFAGGNDFDEFFKKHQAARFEEETSKLFSTHHISKNEAVNYVDISLPGVTAVPIRVRVLNAWLEDAEDSGLVLVPESEFEEDLQSYLLSNKRDVIPLVDQHVIRKTLERAYSLTIDDEVEPANNQLDKNRQVLYGDKNLSRIIDLWLAVFMLPSDRWVLHHYNDEGDKLDTLEESFNYIRAKMSVYAESVINKTRVVTRASSTSHTETRGSTTSMHITKIPKTDPDSIDFHITLPFNDNSFAVNNNAVADNADHQANAAALLAEAESKGSVLYEFDVSRISVSSHREFHNLFLGILLVLSAVERFCLHLHRQRVAPSPSELSDSPAPSHLTPGDLSAHIRQKANDYADLYLYAIRGISILPVLTVAPTPAMTSSPSDSSSSSSPRVRSKYTTLQTGSGSNQRTVDYSATAAYLASLDLSVAKLRATNDCPGEDPGAVETESEPKHGEGDAKGARAERGGDQGAWDGWLWARLFLGMIE